MADFQQDLEKVEATGLAIWRVLVAKEVMILAQNYEFDYKEKEILCDFVYDWVMHSDALPSEVCNWIDCAFNDNTLTIQDFTDPDGKNEDEICEILYRYM